MVTNRVMCRCDLRHLAAGQPGDGSRKYRQPCRVKAVSDPVPHLSLSGKVAGKRFLPLAKNVNGKMCGGGQDGMAVTILIDGKRHQTRGQ